MGYSISTIVKFKVPVIRLIDATGIQPQGNQDFSFLLDIGEDDLGTVQFYIKAKVNIGENFNIELWQIYRGDWGIEENHLPTPNSVKGGEPYGPVDVTGIVSITAYVIAVVSGVVLWARLTFMDAVKPKFMQPIHCFASLMSLMLAVDHTLIALQKDWPWSSSGMIFSYLAIGTLVFYTVFSFYDVEGKEYFGDKKWRYIHVALLFILILWVVLHFGLMGDHLGFLK